MLTCPPGTMNLFGDPDVDNPDLDDAEFDNADFDNSDFHDLDFNMSRFWFK